VELEEAKNAINRSIDGVGMGNERARGILWQTLGGIRRETIGEARVAEIANAGTKP